ncbi:MAG: hypothetical protein GXP29_11580 [Planctomycetes bacterium]|nr:hypothetical protein [Planctomycetota bacterium]
MWTRIRNATAVLVLTTLCVQTFAAPEASKIARRWQLDIEFHDLRRISVTLPGDPQPSAYWYMLYTVTNNTGKEVEFYPTFDLVTSTLQVSAAGQDVSPTVYTMLQERYRKLHPFFRDPIGIRGRLLQGEDHALTSVAVFREFDQKADSVTVYFAGLSGEIAKAVNPMFDPKKPESSDNQRFFPLRKTLAISYDIPGDEVTRATATPIRRLREWIMR